MDEYKVIKIKYNQETKSAHHVFYRRYKPNRNEDLDKLIASDSSETNSALASRTLFVNGLPPYLNVEGTRNVFNIFGQIEHVLMFEKPQSTPFSHISKGQGYFTPDESKSNSFKVAYIVYNQAGSVDKALKKLVTEERIVSTKQNPIPVGFKKWIDDYKNSFIDEKKMKQEIELFMQNYDQEKEKLDEDEISKTNQPDDDGWITVTTKSRKAVKTLTERNIEKLKSKQKKRSEKMSLLHFYNFQAKESKKEYISQLRKRFEEDKLQIEEMKKNRKFKPF